VAKSPLVAQLPDPGSFGAWVLAMRLKTLTAAATPVLVATGVSVAVGKTAWLQEGAWPGLAALMGALLLQIASNFANDVFDFEAGADTDDRLGPPRAAQLGLLTPQQLRRGLIAVLGAALIVGCYLATVRGWPIIAIGLASMLAAVAYTGGPYPLGYHGLGDIFVMLFFGFVAVLGTAYVELGYVPELAYFAAIPVGALSTAILVVNNLRDRESDARVGKRTLAVRLGERGAVLEYAALVLLAYAVPLGLVVSSRVSLWSLLPLFSLPLGVYLVRQVASVRGKAMNALLARTAQLLALYGLLFAVGLAL